jgi:hypothetical protein
MTTRALVVAALLVLAAAWLSLWVGAPASLGPLDVLTRLVGDDASQRTIVRARGLEILLLVLAGSVQGAAGALARRAPAGGEAGGAYGACAAGTAAALAGGLPVVAAAGAAGGVLGHVASRIDGASRRVALVLAAPALFLVLALGTYPGEARPWLEFARRVLGDVAGAEAGGLALAGAGFLVLLAAFLVRAAAPRALLAALAHGTVAAAVGWFPGLATLTARFAPGAAPAAVVGALVAVLGECGLAAAAGAGSLPVGAATGLLAILVALAPDVRRR